MGVGTYGGEERPNGGPPSWWIPFGVKDNTMEAHHRGGSYLG